MLHTAIVYCILFSILLFTPETCSVDFLSFYCVCIYINMGSDFFLCINKMVRSDVMPDVVLFI